VGQLQANPAATGSNQQKSVIGSAHRCLNWVSSAVIAEAIREMGRT
jgi:hypothetical protein